MTRRELIYRWLEALQSGEYKQTHNLLVRVIQDEEVLRHEYCCLGVICDIGSDLGIVIYNHNNDEGIVNYDGMDSVLPDKIVDALGFVSEVGAFTLSDNEKSNELIKRTFSKALSLATLNDVFKFGFKQIAEVIKHNLENGNPDKLFKDTVDMDEVIISELQEAN